VHAGIANNKELSAVRERIAQAKGLVRQAGVHPSPTLGLSGATGKPLGTVGDEEYGGEYSQSVELFGKRGKRIAVRQFSVSIAEAELQERSAQLAFEIRAVYAQLLSERSKLKLLNDLADLNQEALRLTEARVKEGDVPRLEADLLKVEISRSQVSRISAQGRLSSDELEMRRLTGIGDMVPIPDVGGVPLMPVSLSVLKQRALDTRADLKSAHLLEDQSGAETVLAKAETKPDLTLSAGYVHRNSQFDGLYGVTTSGTLAPIQDRENILTFGVTMPLRTSRSGRGNVEAASARTSEARFHREHLELTIPLEVEAAYQRWSAATASLETLRTGVIDPSTTNLSVIREAYRLGQLRLLDVLNEQRRLVDTELVYIDTQADAARTWAEVERAVGGTLP
jgi:cobalt-zinc-cadmium efflux system outer membrane protein